MKERLQHWPSTLIGVAILAFLAYVIAQDRTMLQQPATLIGLAVGLYSLLTKGSNT